MTGRVAYFICLVFALKSLATLKVLGFVQNFDAAGNPARWEMESSTAPTNSFDQATRSIRYFLAEGGFSNPAADLNSIRAAFGQWQSVPGTAIRFEEGGTPISGVDINTSDGTNVVYWAKSSPFVNGGRDNISGTLALTYRRVTNNNEIVEADIVLNGLQVNWFSDFNDTSNPGQFIESSVLHEIGHLLGFEHSPVGGATMFARSLTGVGSQAGLSEDDVAGARLVYALGPRSMGGISGSVLMGSKPVFGAAVFLENAEGTIEQGTVTRGDGLFDFVARQGDYTVRVIPLDPGSPNSLARLLTGGDIAPSYAGAQTSFLPVASSASIQNLQTNHLEIQVSSGIPDFRITRLVTPVTDPANFRAVNAPIQVQVGARNIYVGVCSTSAPPQNAMVSITGGDIVLGPTQVRLAAFSSGGTTLNLLYVNVTLATNAAPGLRSFTVSNGSKTSIAMGFFEVLPLVPDFNFDGLDDRFQRANFAVFTSDEAAPNADPEHDLASNKVEFLGGTNPRDPDSVLKIEHIAILEDAIEIKWQSVPGRVYRLSRTDSLDSGIWVPIEPGIGANDSITSYLDTDRSEQNQFYRIELVK